MKLDFKLREDSGSRRSNRLRNEGQIPAVIYGNGFDTHNIILDEKVIYKVLKSLGENAVINLDIDGKEETAIAYFKKVIADENSAFRNDALWYAGLALLKSNRKTEAVVFIEKAEHENKSLLLKELKNSE